MKKLKQPNTLGERAQFLGDLIVQHSISPPSGTNVFGVAMRREYGDVVGMEIRFYRSIDGSTTLLGNHYLAGISLDAGFRISVDWLHPDIRRSVGAVDNGGRRDKDILEMSKKYIDTKRQYDNLKKELKSVENDLLSIGVDPKSLR